MATDWKLHHKRKYIPDGTEHGCCYDFCRIQMQTLSCYRPWTCSPSNQATIAVRAPQNLLCCSMKFSWAWFFYLDVLCVWLPFLKSTCDPTWLLLPQPSHLHSGSWKKGGMNRRGKSSSACFKEDAPWNSPYILLDRSYMPGHTQLWAHLELMDAVT